MLYRIDEPQRSLRPVGVVQRRATTLAAKSTRRHVVLTELCTLCNNGRSWGSWYETNLASLHCSNLFADVTPGYEATSPQRSELGVLA